MSSVSLIKQASAALGGGLAQGISKEKSPSLLQGCHLSSCLHHHTALCWKNSKLFHILWPGYRKCLESPTPQPHSYWAWVTASQHQLQYLEHVTRMSSGPSLCDLAWVNYSLSFGQQQLKVQLKALLRMWTWWTPLTITTGSAERKWQQKMKAKMYLKLLSLQLRLHYTAIKGLTFQDKFLSEIQQTYKAEQVCVFVRE